MAFGGDAGAGLFEFVHLRHKTYRYGLLTGLVLAMGQLGLSFVLPVFLQDAKHLSAATNGLWMLPTGLFLIVGSQVGGRLTRRFGTVVIVRTGLLLYAAGILLILRVVSLDITVWDLLPGLGLYGFGIGFNYRGSTWGLAGGAFTRHAGPSLSGRFAEDAFR